MHAVIDGFNIPDHAIQDLVILSNKIVVAGMGFGNEDIADFYKWLSTMRKRIDTTVPFDVENEERRATGKGTLKIVARAGSNDKVLPMKVKFKISLWL